MANRRGNCALIVGRKLLPPGEHRQNEQEQLINERTRYRVVLNEQLRREIEVRKKKEAELREQKDYIFYCECARRSGLMQVSMT